MNCFGSFWVVFLSFISFILAFPVQLLSQRRRRHATTSHPGSGGSQVAPAGSPNQNRSGSASIDEALPSALALERVLSTWMSFPFGTSPCFLAPCHFLAPQGLKQLDD